MTTRRLLLSRLLATGGASAVFGRSLIALAGEGRPITNDMIRSAEWISGLSFSEEERELMRKDVEEMLGELDAMRAVVVDNAVPPAIRFAPLEPSPSAGEKAPPATSAPAPRKRPRLDVGDPSLATARELAALLSARKVSSVELAKLSLARIAKLDPVLLAVVTRVPEEAVLEAARRADEERAKGRARGPLHGLPWGAKDLVAVPPYPTTWGSRIFKDRVVPEKATVAERLEKAGCVLVAKTSVGELAWGDVWFGGTTKNPWKTSEGASGSSAGSASGVSAGYFPFAIGTETWGSVISPSTRCGVTGLRPTFGRVSRHGVMALSWTMDKVGVLARSAEDCGLVLSAIAGHDPKDPLSVERPFAVPARTALKGVRIGVPEGLFEEDRTKDLEKDEQKARAREWQEIDRKTLSELERLGATLVPIRLPKDVPVPPLGLILRAEASAAFDDLTRGGRLPQMVRQVKDAWPNVFRQGELIPAVEYIRANRLRTLLMRSLEQVVAGVDLYVSPTFGGDNLLMTNLTGHPQVCLPNGFRASDGTPTSITFTGKLFGEGDLLSVAAVYQEATGFHRKHPALAGI